MNRDCRVIKREFGHTLINAFIWKAIEVTGSEPAELNGNYFQVDMHMHIKRTIFSTEPLNPNT